MLGRGDLENVARLGRLYILTPMLHEFSAWLFLKGMKRDR
jgi:hypothetical protein